MYSNPERQFDRSCEKTQRKVFTFARGVMCTQRLTDFSAWQADQNVYYTYIIQHVWRAATTVISIFQDEVGHVRLKR